MSSMQYKKYWREWNESLLRREATSHDPHKKHFGRVGKHNGKTKGAFGGKRKTK